MNAIGIIRVSRTAGRFGETFASPEIQRERIERAASDNGWRLLDVHTELDVSGGAALHDRPGLWPAVQAVEAGTAKVILTAYGDRLFRDVETERATIRRIENGGGRVFACDRGFISTITAADLLNMTLVGAVNENQRLVAKEKSGAAILRAVSRGALPIPTPFGYRRDELKRLIPDPVTAAIIVEAFELRAVGQSIAQIRSRLSEMCAHAGVKLPSARTVADWFKAPIYTGSVKWNGETFAVEPIVDAKTWRAANAQRGTSRTNSAPSGLLLARLRVLRCANCGRPLQGRMVKGRWGQYQCPAGIECDQPATISSRIAEKTIIEHVKNRLRGISETHSPDEAVQDASDVLAAAQTARDAAIEAFDGLGDVPAAAAKLKELQRAVETAQADLDAATDRQDAAGVAVSVDDWDLLTVEGRRALISAVIDSATVAPGRGGDRLAITNRM
jgi:DNA invertase Pin-like site-specific DNA recombinase